jgi:hypothetical protein
MHQIQSRTDLHKYLLTNSSLWWRPRIDEINFSSFCESHHYLFWSLLWSGLLTYYWMYPLSSLDRLHVVPPHSPCWIVSYSALLSVTQSSDGHMVISPRPVATKGHSSDLLISFIAVHLSVTQSSNKRIDIVILLLLRATTVTVTQWYHPGPLLLRVTTATSRLVPHHSQKVGLAYISTCLYQMYWGGGSHGYNKMISGVSMGFILSILCP